MNKQKLKVRWSGYDVVDMPRPKTTTRVKVWDDTVTREYWLRRDRVIFKLFPESRNEILERYKDQLK